MGNTQHRLQGNKHFKEGRYTLAIAEYTKGLTAENEEFLSNEDDRVKLLLNRSQAHGALGQWAESERDAREALNVGHSNCKAYYLLGKALSHQGSYDQAVLRLQRALALSTTKVDHTQIQNTLLDTKRKMWEAEVAKNTELDQSIMSAISRQAELNASQKDRIKALIEREGKLQQTTTIPPYMICPVNQTLLRDPVVMSPSGNTYERCAIETYIKHTESKGEVLYDPISREIVDPTVTPNHALREAVEDFLEHHPWAASEWLP